MLSILSGVMFAITLLYPLLSIITMNFFLIPLYFQKLTWFDGFIWGVIVFGTYWWWLLLLFQNHSLMITGLILYLLIIAWCSCFSALWFKFFHKAPVISTTIFFMLIIKSSMIVTGAVEGMPFMNPLVLLAEYDQFITPVAWITDVGMLVLLFGIQILIAKNSSYKNFKTIGLFFLIITLGLFIVPTKEESLKKLDEVAVVTPWWYQKGTGMFCGYRLSYDISKAVEQNSKAKIIITPESTFCFDLLEYKNFIPIWCESANDIPILLGGHYLERDMSHNCAIFLHNNQIKYRYVKKHMMPLVEKNLWFERLFCFPILTENLIPNIKEKKSLESENDVIVINEQSYQLFICSEFFFECKRVHGYPIILLWNDSWLVHDYAKKLALLCIKYFEKKYTTHVYHLSTTGLSNFK